jgi:hypothetical protein
VAITPRRFESYRKSNTLLRSSGVEHLIVNQNVAGSIPAVVAMKIDAVKFGLSKFGFINYMLRTYPISTHKICYYWNPYDLSYVGFGLCRIENGGNPFSDTNYMKLREVINKNYPDMKFDEELDGRNYDQEFMRKFLVLLGYYCPEEKVLREIVNSFTNKVIARVTYDENGNAKITKEEQSNLN